MPPENTPQKTLARWKPIHLIAPLITLLMLGATLGYWHKEEQELLHMREHVFQEAAELTTQSIHRRLSNFDLALRGVKGLYESSEEVTLSDFRHYYKALALEQLGPSLQGIAIAIRVPQAQQARHLADMHSLGIADYRIKPEGDRAQYAPIVRIEPFEGSNVKALGFDLASNPGLVDALERARDTGAMALTGRVKLVQDETDALPAVVMYLPIYARGRSVDTLEERRDALVGWVSGPFRMADLMAGLKQQFPDDIGFDIYEGETISSAAQLFLGQHGSGAASVVTALSTTRTLDMGANAGPWCFARCQNLKVVLTRSMNTP